MLLTADKASAEAFTTSDGAAYRERAYAEGQAFLARIDAILPSIAARRSESEANGRVSDETVAEMREAGVFRAFTPLQFGGLEMDPASYFDGIMRIATADSSAAWIAGQLNIHSFEIALMDEQMQQEFWGASPDTAASSSYAPIGKVEEAEGGYVLNGTWTFSSGVDHAEWVILGGKDRAFVVPVSDISIDHSSWDVQGLKGTGSKSLTLTNVFVPEHRAHKFADTANHANPGWSVNDRPLYRLSFSAMFNSTPANTAIGTAKGGLDTFLDQARVRFTRQGTGSPIAQNPFLHLKVANALTQINGVRERHLNNWRAFFDMACRGESASTLERMRVRFEAADAIATSFDTIADLWPMAGAAAAASSNPLQLAFRDLMAARNHGSAGRELAAGMYIKMLLGMDPPPFTDFGTLAFHA